MISQLCKEIEHALKRHIATPKDFEFLRSRIFARHHIYIKHYDTDADMGVCEREC